MINKRLPDLCEEVKLKSINNNNKQFVLWREFRGRDSRASRIRVRDSWCHRLVWSVTVKAGHLTILAIRAYCANSIMLAERCIAGGNYISDRKSCFLDYTPHNGPLIMCVCEFFSSQLNEISSNLWPFKSQTDEVISIESTAACCTILCLFSLCNLR